ncbi:MAG TPA: hypothetical protein PLI34_06100, partial [Saprospiraceae bacterium]|nr:hypothetical protein [Saprospiraceae bacterium]
VLILNVLPNVLPGIVHEGFFDSMFKVSGWNGCWLLAAGLKLQAAGSSRSSPRRQAWFAEFRALRQNSRCATTEAWFKNFAFRVQGFGFTPTINRTPRHRRGPSPLADKLPKADYLPVPTPPINCRRQITPFICKSDLFF